MSVLSDRTLRSRSDLVMPSYAHAIQPCSIDLHLGETLLRLPYGQRLDPDEDQSDIWQDVPLREDERWLIGARELYLGATIEAVTVPDDMVALLHGISSLGRYGLIVHCTAGLVDPGWVSAPLTLEIVSLGGPIFLRPGMRVAQITYHRLDAPVEQPYQGRYRNDRDVTPSRAYWDGRGM